MATTRRQALAGSMAALILPILPGSVSVSHAQQGQRTVRFAIQKPAGDLNPQIYSGLWGAQDLIFEPLIKYGAGGDFVPCLAESLEIEDDGKMLRLHLRQSVTFWAHQDGVENFAPPPTEYDTPYEGVSVSQS